MPEASRRVTSAKVLAAMSQPSRRRLLDVLTVDGPSMVSAMADRTGLAVGSVSHHIGVLAGVGLVEEATELAHDRRERWWKRSVDGITWSTSDFKWDPSSAVVAEAAVTLNLEHHLSKLREWRVRASDAGAWIDAAFATDTWLQLSPGELTELSVELGALLDRWRDRSGRGDEPREPVFVFAHGFPAAP